jgi:hypothetical protein
MWTIVSAPTVISIRTKAGRFTQIVAGIAGVSCFGFGPPPSLTGGVIILPVIFSERIADSRLRPPDASIFFLRISSAEAESAGFWTAKSLPVGDNIKVTVARTNIMRIGLILPADYRLFSCLFVKILRVRCLRRRRACA